MSLAWSPGREKRGERARIRRGNRGKATHCNAVHALAPLPIRKGSPPIRTRGALTPSCMHRVSSGRKGGMSTNYVVLHIKQGATWKRGIRGTFTCYTKSFSWIRLPLFSLPDVIFTRRCSKKKTFSPAPNPLSRHRGAP